MRYILFIITIMLCQNILAQENAVDLNAQRKEVQTINPVTGKKIDHKGIIINPTPHVMLVDSSIAVNVSRKFSIKDVKTGGNNLNPVSGAYSITIDKKGVNIAAYDKRGAFYALQTLRQLIDCSNHGKLPGIKITDYPDLPNRGIVEGFYGTPWSHDVRKSVIKFMGEMKMNTYVYGPKDDIYHSSPNWRLPYPGKEAQNLKELVDLCRSYYIDFVWAIHPGRDIKWDDADFKNLVHKFNIMYDLGVRNFAIFFDDIKGNGTNPLKQAELLNRLTAEFVNKKPDVGPLTVCPTDYTRQWANPSPEGNLAVYGNTLDPKMKIFWTGNRVCSDITRETLEWVNSRIKRPAYFWWNYPVTDYVRHIVLQGPAYGLDNSLSADLACGVLSNPMEHGEASKLALYGVADYAWNIADYNALDNWERGIAHLVPEAAEAYRLFAIHSSDTGKGYRKDESWETSTFRLADWDEAKAIALEQEFERIALVPDFMEARCDNKALLNELRPWLTEFGKLGVRGEKAIELARSMRNDNWETAEIWTRFVSNIMTEDDKKAYAAHSSGTLKLQPFYNSAMADMADKILNRVCPDAKAHSFLDSITPCDSLAYDLNLLTSVKLNSSIEIKVQKGISSYSLFMNQPTSHSYIKQFDINGKLIDESKITSAYQTIAIKSKAVASITISSSIEVFEIVPHHTN